MYHVAGAIAVWAVAGRQDPTPVCELVVAIKCVVAAAAATPGQQVASFVSKTVAEAHAAAVTGRASEEEAAQAAQSTTISYHYHIFLHHNFIHTLLDGGNRPLPSGLPHVLGGLLTYSRSLVGYHLQYTPCACFETYYYHWWNGRFPPLTTTCAHTTYPHPIRGSSPPRQTFHG